MSEQQRFELVFEGLEIGHGRARVAGPLAGRLRSGEVWVMIGPNGCGKTTLLRTLLGLLPALGGRIDGLDGRSVSYVPQLGSFDTGFPVTCEEVVGTGMLRRRDRRRRARQALADVGLAPLARRPFFILSGGQRQRVLLARALCADAAVIALDEPTAGVDAAAAENVWRSCRQLAELGKLVVVVTHDLFRAPEFADHVLAFDDGRLVEQESSAVRPAETR